MRPAAIDAEALDRYLQQRATQDAFSGVGLITQGDAQIFAGAYGLASRAWRIPNTLDIRFDTASVTKLFTAVATLQLVENGSLSFDTHVARALDLTGTAIPQEVTVHHLLTHTSGIADDADEESGEEYADLWKTRSNYGVRETADFLPQFAYRPPNFAPGAGCRYCNCGYVLLGLLIERVTGQPYRDYVRQHIFARSGMLASDFFSMDIVHEQVAEGADPLRDAQGGIVGWQRNIYSYPPIGSPDGGAHVTAGDLDQFLRQLKAGALLSDEFVQQFFTPQVLHDEREAWRRMYGYGIEFAIDAADHVLFAEKEGINAGTSAVLRHYPDFDINVVLLSNMQLGVWEPRRFIHHMLVPESGALS
ncbi:MAG TPA: serine hydrolase domain-containing protein [Ktedonobacterales bacterium]